MSKWTEVVELAQIPVLGSRMIKTRDMDIAVFRGSEDQVYAIRDACPHKNGPLSQGIMHGTSVTCPLHNWRIDLTSGEALGPDEGCANVFPVRVEDGLVYLQLQPSEAAA
ncbi:nitrite reductase small subunit NirD [endosymbiont of Ridgeia piscesae]|jgi:nitrite reductase (NADH) small subunit|uniref:Assimilatory nitrite reductase (NAD(P)H) small subunit n=1 Tax=endosymbiont of Ridgeia piscesae TaxID=54398 RepID=A0A0T5Z2D6_9GAMM|nr:nitrite reductase small subunit NirD [endosymbiont of Ridgeia piscesae]KRT55224.1 assimilatory nitrite reductase (NAD(P)H) small subunit [endosymbiont of Ridgeia piscesae]KRT57049.1 assimilatory nitrite reductase (NAD(P)H) small subunit [endosymbiont of Ridgeia piscesae]